MLSNNSLLERNEVYWVVSASKSLLLIFLTNEDVAETIRQRAAPDDIVATYAQSMPSLAYYLRRHVEDLFDVDELAVHLKSGKPVFAVMSEEDLSRVRGDLPGPLCVIDRRPTLDVRLKSVLAADPPPQLVLVANRCN